MAGAQSLAVTAAFGTLLLAGTAAFAQSSAPMPQAASAPPASQTASPTAQAMKVPTDAHVEARIKQLHAQLKITPDEESKWNDVAQAMRDNEQNLASLVSKRNSSTKGMTAIDNLKSYEDITDAHSDGLKKLVPAFSSLYDAMPDAQKKVADKVFARQVRAPATASKAAPAAKPTNG
jgi:hypothetical protein